MDVSTDHKRTKTSLTFEEKIKQIDRAKFDIFEYATELLHLISNENNQTLPTLEQLQLLENKIFRFYWTSDQQKTWSEILDLIKKVFQDVSNEIYLKNLLENNPNDQKEIERLLQIIL